ncbi:hypothetical protein TNCV_1953191 [Trichonephila clavipes]|nr:hypothetical protein TNCV_3915601 [Trichonephila clavipes]GFX55999.1 hypothetical protein TNCV_1953191 [Trichonephila clavipes]
MAPHKPRKSAPIKYTTEEENMIVYDVEDEPESNPDNVKKDGKISYKEELVVTPYSAYTRYDFRSPTRETGNNFFPSYLVELGGNSHPNLFTLIFDTF